MPLVAKDSQHFYISRIRALLVVSHHMTHVEMLDKLKAEGITLDREYLSKLVGTHSLRRRPQSHLRRVRERLGREFHACERGWC